MKSTNSLKLVFFSHLLSTNNFLSKSFITPTNINLLTYSPKKTKFLLKWSNVNHYNLIDLFFYQHPNKKILNTYTLYSYTNGYYFNLYTGFTRNVSNCEIYPSLNWLEREYQEFTGEIIYNSPDTRNLMLDYNKTYNPILKIFPCVGFEEVYYDNFTDQVKYIPVNFIEL